jgi:hypothetical protein
MYNVSRETLAASGTGLKTPKRSEFRKIKFWPGAQDEWVGHPAFFSPLQKFVPMNIKLRISASTQLEQIHSLQLAFSCHPLSVDAIQ